MRRLAFFVVIGSVLLVHGSILPAGASKKLTAKEALQPFNDLIGEWKGTGVPKGTPQQQQKGFWVENMDWVWKFKDGDAWLACHISNGKHYVKAELRYLPDKNQYELTLRTVDKKTVVFVGTFEDKQLTVQRDDPDTKETQKLSIRLLHHNRFLYQYDVKPEDKTFYTKVYQVGVTKLGEDFATGDGRPECIVTGGLGTMTVKYKSETYYVCCTGCRDEFVRDPQKYIDLAAKKKMKK